MIKRRHIQLKLKEDLLGTIPKNKDVYATFIASKCADKGLAEEEVATVQSIEERGWTGFHQDEEGFFIYDYAIKGFLCEAARTIKTFGTLKQLQDKFKRYAFIRERRVRLPEPKAYLERPLRALTPMGPRVTVVRSDKVPAGTVLDFHLDILDASGISEGCVKEVLSYGQFVGLGQWRTGSYGRFEVVKFEEV